MDKFAVPPSVYLSCLQFGCMHTHACPSDIRTHRRVHEARTYMLTLARTHIHTYTLSDVLDTYNNAHNPLEVTCDVQKASRLTPQRCLSTLSPLIGYWLANKHPNPSCQACPFTHKGMADIPPAKRQRSCAEWRFSSSDLIIVHFNDVYNITPNSKEPVGVCGLHHHRGHAARTLHTYVHTQHLLSVNLQYYVLYIVKLIRTLAAKALTRFSWRWPQTGWRLGSALYPLYRPISTHHRPARPAISCRSGCCTLRQAGQRPQSRTEVPRSV